MVTIEVSVDLNKEYNQRDFNRRVVVILRLGFGLTRKTYEFVNP